VQVLDQHEFLGGDAGAGLPDADRHHVEARVQGGLVAAVAGDDAEVAGPARVRLDSEGLQDAVRAGRGGCLGEVSELLADVVRVRVNAVDVDERLLLGECHRGCLRSGE
jgi:hypothetical protein